MTDLYTTLNKIREHKPCVSGWNTLLNHLNKTQADDDPVSFLTILESNGLDDAIWCTRSTPEYNKQWRLFAVFCGRQVQHLMQDERSIYALDVSEKYANGLATEKELSNAAACIARTAAAGAAGAAAAYAYDAGRAAGAAGAAGAAYATYAARAADARYAAAAAYAADSAYDAGRAAYDAAAAACAAAAYDGRAVQKEQFIKIIKG